jgi:hypothetical protein
MATITRRRAVDPFRKAFQQGAKPPQRDRRLRRGHLGEQR